MQQYLIVIEFIFLGLIGAYFHYLEKRFFHLTTKTTLVEYLMQEREATYKAIGAVIAGCYGLALTHNGGYFIEVSEFVSCVLIGYGFDNALNKAHDSN
jgi:hypothetical protein